jgi:hypothetical protein
MMEMESIGRMSVVGKETGFSYLFVVYLGQKGRDSSLLESGITQRWTIITCILCRLFSV